MKLHSITYFTLTVFASVFITSCKKEKLPDLPPENDPYYSVRGLVNGDSISWNVGENSVTLSYGADNFNKIESYYGQINNTTDDQTIRIEVLRPEIFASTSGISSVEQGQIPLLTNKSGAIKLNFGISYGQFNYVLVKDDESNNFAQMNEIDFKEYGVHDLTLKFTDYSPSESFTLPVKFGFENQVLKAGFTSNGSGDTLNVLAENTDGSHQWYLNNVLVSEESGFSKHLEDGIYKLKHVLTDAFGNSADYTTLIRFKEGHFYWQMKYYYIDQPACTSHYGNIIVSMKKDGVWYSTLHAAQNENSFLTTSNIVTELNNNLKPVSTRFNFDFGTVLYTADQTDSLVLSSFTGKINVGFN